MKMTTVHYYRISWVLPLVLPLIALALESLLNQIGLRLPDMAGMGIGLSFSAVFMFFIPYATLVGVYLLVLRNRSGTAYAVAILLSPVVMALFVSLFIFLAGTGPHDAIRMSIFFARYCFAIGYFYVALIFALLWILRRFRVVA